MRCLTNRVKKLLSRNLRKIEQPSRYETLTKRIIPPQQLDNHLIRACEKIRSIGNEEDKAYCDLLLDKLSFAERNHFGFITIEDNNGNNNNQNQKVYFYFKPQF